MHTIYKEHLKEPETQLALVEAGEIASKRKSALLCLEADHARCHRSIIADRLAKSHGFRIENL